MYKNAARPSTTQKRATAGIYLMFENIDSWCSHVDPPASSCPTRHGTLELRKPLSVFLVVAYQSWASWLATTLRVRLVELPRPAKQNNRWNLPNAGVACRLIECNTCYRLSPVRTGGRKNNTLTASELASDLGGKSSVCFCDSDFVPAATDDQQTRYEA